MFDTEMRRLKRGGMEASKGHWYRGILVLEKSAKPPLRATLPREGVVIQQPPHMRDMGQGLCGTT